MLAGRHGSAREASEERIQTGGIDLQDEEGVGAAPSPGNLVGPGNRTFCLSLVEPGAAV